MVLMTNLRVSKNYKYAFYQDIISKLSVDDLLDFNRMWWLPDTDPLCEVVRTEFALFGRDRSDDARRAVAAGLLNVVRMTKTNVEEQHERLQPPKAKIMSELKTTVDMYTNEQTDFPLVDGYAKAWSEAVGIAVRNSSEAPPTTISSPTVAYHSNAWILGGPYLVMTLDKARLTKLTEAEQISLMSSQETLNRVMSVVEKMIKENPETNRFLEDVMRVKVVVDVNPSSSIPGFLWVSEPKTSKKT